MDGATYEQWVTGYDVDTGKAKGRLRSDDQAVRFVEVTVNGSKTWSLAAALHPQVTAAYDAAQDRAAEQIIAWLAEHATTRVGPRGRQVQVRSRRSRRPSYATSPPGRATRIATCTCRSMPGSARPAAGAVCTRSGCATVWRPSTASAMPRS
jgi:hypothetical protein